MSDRGSRRLVLLISSQCANLDEHNQLVFLPPIGWQPDDEIPSARRLAIDLYEQFLDPDAGACDPVPDLAGIDGAALHRPGSSLLINPTLAVAKHALKHSFRQAQELQSVLVVHFVGHGVELRLTANDPPSHLLLLADSARDPQSSDDAWNPYDQANELIKTHGLPGFVFLVDACLAAQARPQIGRWGSVPVTYVWMGASQDTAAFDGCFSATLLDMMRRGEPARAGRTRPTPELFSHHLRQAVDTRCKQPELHRFQEADDVTSRADDYVFITRNRAAATYEDELGLVGATRDRLRSAIGDHYQLIDISSVIGAMEAHSLTVVTGGAGTGKTALLSVLRDPPDTLDARRLDGIAFLEASTTLDSLADDLHPQLIRNGHFADLIRRHELRTAEPDIQGPFQRYLAGPLNGKTNDVFTIGIDGLDQLDAASATVIAGLEQLVQAAGGHLRIVVSEIYQNFLYN